MVNGFRQVAVHYTSNGMYVARRWSPCEFPENLFYPKSVRSTLFCHPHSHDYARCYTLATVFFVTDDA